MTCKHIINVSPVLSITSIQPAYHSGVNRMAFSRDIEQDEKSYHFLIYSMLSEFVIHDLKKVTISNDKASNVVIFGV